MSHTRGTWLSQYMHKLGLFAPSDTAGGACLGVGCATAIADITPNGRQLLLDKANQIAAAGTHSDPNPPDNLRDILKAIDICSVPDANDYNRLFATKHFLTQSTGLPYTMKNMLPLFHPTADTDHYIHEVDCATAAFDFTGLHAYFQTFGNLARQNTLPHPITMVMTGSEHTIHVGFDTSKQHWLLTDEAKWDRDNTDTTLFRRYVSDDDIAREVHQVFAGQKPSSLSIFNSRAFANAESKDRMHTFFSSLKSDACYQSIKRDHISEDNTGFTLLHLAAMQNDLAGVKAAVNAGADVNLMNDKVYSPLHLAAMVGNVEMVKFLLSKGAYINAQTANKGMTALMIATVYGHIGVIKALLAEHAEEDFQSNSGHYAVDFAEMYGHKEIADFLSALPLDLLNNTDVSSPALR